MTRRRLKHRYEAPAVEPPVVVRPLSPFPPGTGGPDEPPPTPTRVEDAIAPASEAEIGPAIEADLAARLEAPAEAAAPTRGGRKVRGAFFVIGLALAAFITGLVVFNGIVMPRLIHGIGQIEVPDVRNLTLDQAEAALGPLNLQVSRAGERFDPSLPRGFILSQDPAPGTAVRGSRRVSVIVSLGEEFSSVPELSGESQRSAEQLLRSSGLRLGAIARAPSDEVGEGLVVGSDPGAESVLPQGSPVSLLVSAGSGEESFVMPDLVGREFGGARRQLESLGFRVIAPPGTPTIGTIVDQRPAAGSRITAATEIFLQATGRIIR